MAVAAAPLPAAPPPERTAGAELAEIARLIPTLAPGRSVTVQPVDWDGYEFLVEARDESGRRNLSIAYDGRRVELVSHSNLHEMWKSLLSAVLYALCEELHVPLVGLGNATLRREDLDRGFEPDFWCYLGGVAGRMREPVLTRPLNYMQDPPPSLAIEIEMSRSLLDRISLCATLGIPEVWRFDGERLTVLHLQAAGGYQEVPQFLHFPNVPPGGLLRFMAMTATCDNVEVLRRFREWVRTLAPATP